MNLKVIASSLAALAVIGVGTWYFLSSNDEAESSPVDSELISVPAIIETPDEFQQIKRTPPVVEDELTEAEVIKETPPKKELREK